MKAFRTREEARSFKAEKGGSVVDLRKSNEPGLRPVLAIGGKKNWKNWAVK